MWPLRIIVIIIVIPSGNLSQSKTLIELTVSQSSKSLFLSLSLFLFMSTKFVYLICHLSLPLSFTIFCRHKIDRPQCATVSRAIQTRRF